MKVHISIFIILLANYCCHCLPRPLQVERVETDPELTAGYFEGDKILDDVNRNGLIQRTRQWPDKKVYYRFHDDVAEEHKTHVRRGIEMLEQVSCIRFFEVDRGYPNYVNITTMGGGCFSTVGYTGRIQTYNLQPYPLDTGCFRLGTIMHEFLHTLGFYHMQSTHDRDEYVRIATENIEPVNVHNFNTYNSSVVDNFDEEYDYRSILHYSAYAFSINGEMTIQPLKDTEAAKDMGQRRELTKSDINKLNTMYRCPIDI